MIIIMKRIGKNLGIVARINFLCIVFVATICYDPNQLVCSAGVLSAAPPSTPPTTPPTTSTGGSGGVGVSYKDRTIGCLYSDVCPEDQVCFDDHAFGRCEQYDPISETFTSDYIYELDRKTLQLLDKEWTRLNHQGFYWSHPYTQCILKVILNDRPRSRYDPEQCEQYLVEKNNGGNSKHHQRQRQQRQPKQDLDRVSEKSGGDDDNDLFMNIQQTLSKYLVPYDGPLPPLLSVAETSRKPFRKPQPIEKQQRRQHQNELNKESLPLISLFPPQAPPQAQPPPPPSVSVSSSSSKKSLSPKNSQTSTPSSGKHIDMLQLFPVLFRNNDQHGDEDGYNHKYDDDDNLKSWENFDLDKNRELLDYLQDMINNGNHNGDEQIDGLTEFPGITLGENPDPRQQQEKEEEQQHGNYVVPNKNLMKTTSLFHQDDDDVNDFGGGNSPSEFQEQEQEEEQFNDPKLIETLFHDADIIGNGDHHYGGHDDDRGDDRRGWKQRGKDLQSSPLMSILKTIPEIRIIRDTEDINTNTNNNDNDGLDPFDLTLIETSSTATVDDDADPGDGHQEVDDKDLMLLDLDEDRGGAGYQPDLDGLDLDYGDLLLLNEILNSGKLIQDDGLEQQQEQDADDDHDHGHDGHMSLAQENGDESMVDVPSSSPTDFDDRKQDDDDDDDRKEILIGDINYSNNYLLQNFYRNHRYDIKKPGPIFLEDYILENLSSKPDDSDPAAADMVQNAAANNNGGAISTDNGSSSSSSWLAKKDFSIRSQQPVAEGPVKLDSATKDQLIIRSATTGEKTDLEAIDSTHAYVVIDQMLGEEDSGSFLQTIEQLFNLPRGTFSNLRKEDYQITFKVNPNYQELNASQVATRIEDSARLIQDMTGLVVKETGIGDKTKLPVVSARRWQQSNDAIIRMTFLVTTIILSIISGAFVVYLFRRNGKFREKIKGFMKLSEDWIKFDYQDLCRQRFRNKSDGSNKSGAADSVVEVEKKECNKAADRSSAAAAMKNAESGSQHGSQHDNNQGTNPPSRSSTSSYVEEPVSTNMDITTGHIILSYMEDHLKRKDRLDQEWEALCTYEADPGSCNAALQNKNAQKNRYPNILPYDHSRVILNDEANVDHSDYTNANTITDHDPRNPAYIATQGPLANTKADFWQMIWEQGSVLIVMLTRLRENGLNMCERYWPEEGSEVYGNFEVHLVSEHIWCDDYLVRSFYLKNLKTGETRTVTQFHYLSWPEMGVAQSIKSLLDFRRKVNKSYKGRSCPIVVHCNDGVGRTGTYILIDMVLNRLAKGAKEIDLAASLEHIRDQRGGMVKTKQQFEFVLSAVADEVQAILKTLPN